SLVDPAISSQTLESRGRCYELPEALGADSRDRGGIEAALDHGREGEILGEALSLEDVVDHSERLPGPPHPEPRDLTVSRREAIDEESHLGVHRDRVRGDLRER